jgi:GrpB-like predicted nucleotidyltransferase (UPF0157 family)/2'-5' RNA ligase
MKSHRPYELKEYDPKWKEIFNDVVEKLRPIFGDNFVEADHIGSTSVDVPDMLAKPQVDTLVVVKDLDLVKNYYKDFENLGFTVKGRGYVNPDDEYIHLDNLEGKRIASIHILQEGNSKIEEYKMFRDYLKENKEDRELYICAKKDLYEKYKDNYAEYDSQKRKAVNEIKERAKNWWLQKFKNDIKIFALYTRVKLTQKPEWLDDFRKRFNQAYDIHVTFIQPRYIDDEKVDDLKSRVTEFFDQNKLTEKDRTIECKDLVYGKNSEGLYTFMLLAEKSENLLAYQKKLKEYLKDFGNYVEPTKEKYEIDFKPHITIGVDVAEDLVEEAKSYFQPNDSVSGVMNEMVLAVVKEQTVEESLNPDNLTIFKTF